VRSFHTPGWGPALDAELHAVAHRFGFYERVAIGSAVSSFAPDYITRDDHASSSSSSGTGSGTGPAHQQHASMRLPSFSVSAPVFAAGRTRVPSRAAKPTQSQSQLQPPTKQAAVSSDSAAGADASSSSAASVAASAVIASAGGHDSSNAGGASDKNNGKQSVGGGGDDDEFDMVENAAQCGPLARSGFLPASISPTSDAAASSASSSSSSSSSRGPPAEALVAHIPGRFEQVELCLANALLSISGFPIFGRVFLTNFRLCFFPESLFARTEASRSFASSSVSSAKPAARSTSASSVASTASASSASASSSIDEMIVETMPDPQSSSSAAAAHSHHPSHPPLRFDPQTCVVLPFGLLVGVEMAADFTSLRTPANAVSVECSDFRSFKLLFTQAGALCVLCLLCVREC
jgi:hypothetical protein